MLKIVIYHGGQFFGYGSQIYLGGKVDEVGRMDTDYISVGEIGYVMKDLGYIQMGDL